MTASQLPLHLVCERRRDSVYRLRPARQPLLDLFREPQAVRSRALALGFDHCLVHTTLLLRGHVVTPRVLGLAEVIARRARERLKAPDFEPIQRSLAQPLGLDVEAVQHAIGGAM